MNKEETISHVERALDIALIVLQGGGSTILAERTFRNVLKGIDNIKINVAWRLDLVLVNILRDGKSESILRPVGPIGVNLTRTSEAVSLSERIEKGLTSIDAAENEINRIESLAPAYNKWIMIAAASFTAACYSKVLSGDTGSLVIALIAACAGQMLRGRLQKLQFSVLAVTFVSGIISACIAAAGLQWQFSQQVPATMISSVIYLVPGLPLINAFMDIVSHKYLLIGLERLFNAALLFLILALNIVIALTAINF
jgi:uncharacterized membrane protein YjjP (DUF1212 family)